MIKRFQLKFICLILWAGLSAPSHSFAWGPAGHKAVALIAQDRLSPEARQKIGEIIGTGSGLPQIASCADFIRGNSGTYCGHAFRVDGDPASARWHYIDIPISDSPNADSLEQYCSINGQKDDCVVDQIRDDMKTLQDPEASQSRKQIALMFLVHFVGDLHQPMHCSTEKNDDGTTNRGGNTDLLTFLGAPDNLHKLWDDVIEPPPPPYSPGKPKNSGASALDAYAIARTLEKNITDDDVNSWTSGDIITEAALESFQTAKNMIYPSYHESQDHVFTEDYRKEMQPIAFERIERAGVRLAYLLEQALGTSSEEAAQAPDAPSENSN